MISLLLSLCLLTPETLGEALIAVGAFDERLDLRLEPPPAPPRRGSRLMIGLGLGLAVLGLAGLSFSQGCETQAADGRCLAPTRSQPLFPALVVLGLAGSITGSYWFLKESYEQP